ncbi:MAG TPA: glutamate--tRNA ligase [Alphaproteobacteria bacterium]|nr:glutamate--tRNA ligase [Alphaproteobacteria bacterium]
MTVAVRFAPSPTGLLHLGNIRAALFNWLFARRYGGTFMLRLDDTDRDRSTVEFANAIEGDLNWLGLNWDRFARQSDRLEHYDAALERLKTAGRAYPCFETQAELDLKRKTQLGRGLPPVYDRAALKLSDAERARLIAAGKKPHWRFRLDGDAEWDDAIQGKKHFPTSALSDPVLVREDGVPLYTFSSVVDDVELGITHVIRGEDHVTNTAVQIQIWQALTDKPPPIFAHFPLIVTASGIEMSKRLGTLSIASLRGDMEIEPMAINSLLARLGTSEPVGPHLALAELARAFDLGKISHSGPKFDMADLQALNAKILHMTPFANLRERLKEMGLGDIDENFWNAVRANIMKLGDIAQWWQVAQGPITPIIADAAFARDAAGLLPPEPWNENSWGAWADAVKSKTGRKGKDLFMPLRLALTGLDHGPEMKALLPIIGPARTRARLEGKAA